MKNKARVYSDLPALKGFWFFKFIRKNLFLSVSIQTVENKDKAN
jgi:hypothetical protein